MERSFPEKSILEQVLDAQQPLPFKLELHHDETFEDELFYVIPEEKKAEALKKCWPFADCPALDEELLDIHSSKLVTLSECFIIRWHERNIIVSPHYWEDGGMVIDLLKKEGAEEDEAMAVFTKVRTPSPTSVVTKKKPRT